MQASSPNPLSAHAFFRDAPPELLDRLARSCRAFRAEPNHILVDFDDPGTDVFLVLSGHLRVSIQTANGERIQILGDVGPGDLVGEMAAIDNVTRSARIEALVRTSALALPAAAFLGAVDASSMLALRLMRLLTERIRAQNRRILELTALPIRLRLAAELLRLSRPKPDGTRVLNPMPTQEELAFRIGARRETVSRELAAMTALGQVRRSRVSIVLCDPAGLGRSVAEALEGSPIG